MINNEDFDAPSQGLSAREMGVCLCETINCKYDACQPRGLSELSGEQFPPTLCGRVGEAAPMLLNKTIKL